MFKILLAASAVLTVGLMAGASAAMVAVGASSYSVNATSTGILLTGPTTVTSGLNVQAGGYSAGGVAGVSCAAGTVNLTTLTVTSGIVTHC